LGELIVKSTKLKEDHTVVFLWLNQMFLLHITIILCLKRLCGLKTCATVWKHYIRFWKN